MNTNVLTEHALSVIYRHALQDLSKGMLRIRSRRCKSERGYEHPG